MDNKRTITVAIFEKETDKQVRFKEADTTNSPFEVATTELTDYLDTTCQSKPRGTTEHFIVFVMIDNDNPFRILFEVVYGPKKWKKIYKGMPQINESGTEPYQYRWEVPEDIDGFPTNAFTTEGKRIFLDIFPQARRFSTYKAINETFENRIRVRINRRPGIHPETGWCSYDSVQPDLEPIDYVVRLAKEETLEDVITWALDEDCRHARQSSGNEIRELIALINTSCSREISILHNLWNGKQERCMFRYCG